MSYSLEAAQFANIETSIDQAVLPVFTDNATEYELQTLGAGDAHYSVGDAIVYPEERAEFERVSWYKALRAHSTIVAANGALYMSGHLERLPQPITDVLEELAPNYDKLNGSVFNLGFLAVEASLCLFVARRIQKTKQPQKAVNE